MLQHLGSGVDIAFGHRGEQGKHRVAHPAHFGLGQPRDLCRFRTDEEVVTHPAGQQDHQQHRHIQPRVGALHKPFAKIPAAHVFLLPAQSNEL